MIEKKKSLQKEVIIMGIETSCDDTAVAVVLGEGRILSNLVSSQADFHQRFGGVVPEIASRHHLEAVNLLVDEALREAGMKLNELSAIAVTYGPGLVGALLMGVTCAKALSYAAGLPLIAVNHIEGHLYANFLLHRDLELPLVALIVSGGHTNLVYIEEHGCFEVLGRTRDDAAGEVFDKVARALGLGYPGGPIIDRLSAEGNPEAITFPRAFLEGNSLDFSFSGVKSAVLNYINRMSQKNEEIDVRDLAASFQQAVVEVLVEKAIQAAERKNVKTIALSGGVAANLSLRSSLSRRASEEGYRVYYPPLEFCTDNGAMIACAGIYQYLKKDFASMDLNAVPGLQLSAGCDET
ncbi:tRNA (adenosine(37)-N6)-threonylcarbamoyltransferase complex transferase subunit TsaD [Candidatus Contubernalis alkalaceticus]|nr:tRNA (adenosine(37)-N6)-threonylcarbamoyltransferase complex transferase subunit TsaD [Candidatus Contubernalis alkalaceticus]